MLNGAGPAILQFGTSRFLQAHVDLFVSEALERGQALGAIAVVQTTDSPASSARLAALAAPAGYPVQVRGLQQGQVVDRVTTCRAIRTAWNAQADWALVRAAIQGPVDVIVSNTGDSGYDAGPGDSAALLADPAAVPRGFPAKLVSLLLARWQARPQAALSIFPCELIERNGDTLRDLVVELARGWQAPAGFVAWLQGHCRWANSLVDRIVSEPLQPAGAIAEPYALWAIERQAGLVLPCAHEAIVVTGELRPYAQRKLFLLNLGHTVLAERWLSERRSDDETVLHAMNDGVARGELEAVWRDEVLPVFDAIGEGAAASTYLDEVRERFLNPFLVHRLSDIARNHGQKKQRRFAPVIRLAEALGLHLPQPRLREALASGVTRPEAGA